VASKEASLNKVAGTGRTARNHGHFLLRRIVDGTAGWATYQQAAKRQGIVEERRFYDPIEDIAHRRRWNVINNASIAPKAPRSGAPRSIDFVFYRTSKDASGPGLILAEVKYLRGQNAGQDLQSLRDDMDQLRDLTAAQLVQGDALADCGAPSRVLLVIGQHGALEKTANYNSRNHSRIAAMLYAGLFDRDNAAYYASAETYRPSRFHWTVLGSRLFNAGV